MKLTWMKWSAVPVAVLLAGSVAMAQDQPAPSSQPAPPAPSGGSTTAATPATTATPAAKPKPTVAQRKENQQDRIAQGMKSGQLTAGETANLENQQKGINQQVAADRKANGGTLTASEKKQVNKEQNVASKNIYHKKHNAKTQPQAQPKP